MLPEDRFQIDATGSFEFMGRALILQLVQAIDDANAHDKILPINAYGTKGFARATSLQPRGLADQREEAAGPVLAPGARHG